MLAAISSGILLGGAWVTGRWRGEPHRNLARSPGLLFTPCFFPVFLTDVFTASSDVTPFHVLTPTAAFGFVACDYGNYIYPYTCVGRFLSARLLSAHSEKSPLFVFSVPWDTRRTWPCTKPAGAGGGLIPLSGRAALICLRAEPTRIWLEATTELQLELFVAQT